MEHCNRHISSNHLKFIMLAQATNYMVKWIKGIHPFLISYTIGLQSTTTILLVIYTRWCPPSDVNVGLDSPHEPYL